MEKMLITNSHLRQDAAKWVLWAIMRHHDASSVIDEVVKVEQIHLVLQ